LNSVVVVDYVASWPQIFQIRGRLAAAFDGTIPVAWPVIPSSRPEFRR
jgi:hypothetical protein